MSEVRLKKGETVASALRRLKKLLDQEGTLKIVRENKYYVKPSEKRYKQMKRAKFNNKIQSKREKMSWPLYKYVVIYKRWKIQAKSEMAVSTSTSLVRG